MKRVTENMKNKANIFLIGSVTALALSMTGPGGEFLWGFLKPVGALLFGAFFITNLLANEYAKYDQEQPLNQPVGPKATAAKSSPSTTGRFEVARRIAGAVAK